MTRRRINNFRGATVANDRRTTYGAVAVRGNDKRVRQRRMATMGHLRYGRLANA